MRLYVKYLNAKSWMREKLSDKKGDTNFISLIIILAIVLGLAAMFGGKFTELATTYWDKINGTSIAVPSGS